MKITSKVNMDLRQQLCPPVISAVQDDRYSRNVEISLYDDGVSWTIPEDAAVLIRYKKSDGIGGEYDVLPDGTTAWSALDNVLTVELAPQVLTVPGAVILSVTMIREEVQISTFDILINVSQAVRTGIGDSESYHHVIRFLPAPSVAKTGQHLRISQIDEQGKITQLEAVDPPEYSGGAADPTTVLKIVEDYLQENPPECRMTVNGESADENGDFVINTLNDDEIAQLSAILN